MAGSLRRQILLTLSPLLLLVAVLGSAGVLLLHHLGESIKVILKDNYESIVAMQDLKDSLGRMNSSCQLMLIVQDLQVPKERQALEEKPRQDFTKSWQKYQAALTLEQNNITIHPAEDEMVQRLEVLTARCRRQTRDFFQPDRNQGTRHKDYFDSNGLHDLFREIKLAADDILYLNQEEMVKASYEAIRGGRSFRLWMGIGVVAAMLLAALFAWYTARTILRPIEALTHAAQGISQGNLDAVVPYLSADELGQLANAFNTMAHHLRDYRLSQTAMLLRAQRTSQATIDSFPDPVVVVDSAGLVQMANPAACHWLGVMPGRNSQATEISAPWQAPEALRLPLVRALQKQEDYLPEEFDRTIVLSQNGKERILLPRILTIRDPEGLSLGAAVLLQDVTRLRLLDQIKSNLVATASHELKTPLTGIRLVIYLLLEEKVGPLEPKQLELLLDARDNSERLLAVVNNLLDLTRLEQGWRQLDVKPETPESLLQTAADRIRPRAQDKGVEIVLEIPLDLPAVAADASRLGSALGNLLDNALAYTDRGGKITLSAAAAEPEGVMLTVADTGCGIPPEHLSHVFEKFFRVPGQSRGNGTGLGLAIVQEIVTAHGGTVTCTSQPNVGTAYRMILPLAKEAHPADIFGHGRIQI